MVHGALILELTMAAAGVAHITDDPVQAMCDIAAGYDAVLPLEAEEVDLLFDLVITRLVAEYVICNWRVIHPTSSETQHLVDYCTAFEGALERMLAVGRKAARDRLRRALQFPPYCPPTEEPDATADAVLDDLIERRRRVLGPKQFCSTIGRSTSSEAKGSGSIGDRPALSRRLQQRDHVGHSHRHVLRAISRQYAALCTNTRYVYSNILDYAERLTATTPGGPRVCVFRQFGQRGERHRLAHGQDAHRQDRRDRPRAGLSRWH